MAYGARLESVLGASPHGFESHILRSEKAPDCSGAFVILEVSMHSRSVRGLELCNLFLS